MTVRQTLDVTALGYDYAADLAPTRRPDGAPSPPPLELPAATPAFAAPTWSSTASRIGPVVRGARVHRPPDGGRRHAPALDEPGYAGSFTVFGHGGCFGDGATASPARTPTSSTCARRIRCRADEVADRDRRHPPRAWIEPAVQEVTVTVVAVTPDDGFPKAGPEPGRFD